MRYILCFLFLTTLVYGQSGITPGVVIPKVQLDAATNETYAVYLPRTYDDAKEYPAVFIFNDSDDTARVVQQFTIGAELTESIIIGANHKVKDTLNEGLKDSEKLINNAFDQFSIDRSKIILAGINEGALVASTSAHLSDNVYGVIVVGNAFIDKKVLKNKENVRFSLLSSNEGGGFYKLRAYDNGYGLRDIVKGYYEYDGKGWPEAGYLAAALTDMLLTEETDISKVETYYKSELEFARQLFKRDLQLEAYAYTDGLKSKYKKRVDIDEQADLLKEIRADRGYKFKKIRASVVSNSEDLLIQDFNYYLNEDSQNAFFDNLGWWSYQMDDLDLKIDSTSTNKTERKAALRLKDYLVKSVEEKYELLKIGNASPEQLLFINVLRTLVNPLNQDAHIQTISLSSREGDYNAALFYLEELMKTGYDDYERLYQIDNTIALRTGPAYNEIVKAYLGKSKYYDN